MRQVYVNGRYLPESEAQVSVFDRGFLFGDAVYEVTLVLDGKLVDFGPHMARLRRSLGELGLVGAPGEVELLDIHRELVTRNGVAEGMVYLQVTRGVADRDFEFPRAGTPLTTVLFTQHKSVLDNPDAARGLRVVTVDDLRWRRCDIKTVQLLYQSMAKVQARSRGADDAWMVRDEHVTEGSSNNAFIVTADGSLITRQLSSDILHGITRVAVMECARSRELRIAERPFTVKELMGAQEAFSTSSTGLVSPVVSVDDRPIGTGRPGPVAGHLRQIYIERARATAI